ncbi:MAG: CPBP family glutamic-type intramembrane protease [Kofleriaceae bacterium]
MAPRSAFSPAWAVGLTLGGVATLMVAGGLIVQLGAPLYVGIALGDLAMLALPVIALRRLRLPAAAIGWRAPAGRDVAAGLLIGATAWYLNMRLAGLFELPGEETRQLSEAVARPSLPLTLLAFAVAPAICEEVLFRGVLLRSFASRMPAALAVAICAALFSGYHFKLVQMPATFTLGLVLGALALRGHSIVPAMLAHFFNNALALLVSRGDLPELARVAIHHPTAMLVVCGVGSAAGIALIALPRRPARGAA